MLKGAADSRSKDLYTWFFVKATWILMGHVEY